MQEGIHCTEETKEKIRRAHHRNKIKDDNRLENLIGFTSESTHKRFHSDPAKVKPEEIFFDGRLL